MHNDEATILDRLISVLTYFTFGMAGFIWILITFFTKNSLKRFVSYHIYQSIFLSILLYMISLLCSIAFGLMIKMPYIGTFAERIAIFFAGTPVYTSLNYSIVHLMIFTLICYFSLGAILGKYSYFPYISDIIKSNLRRY